MPGIEFNKGIPDDIDKGNYLDQGVYKNGRWNASESFETCVMRGPPTLFESDFIAFSCFKMAGCLSEEELEIAISLNGSFCSAVRK